jgi:SAM-dependent methyltransferase
MATDVYAAAEFYATARGAVAARLVRQRLAGMWPGLAGLDVLGLGYAAPYLRLWQGQARRCIAACPAQIGVARRPPAGPGLTCMTEEDALPFPDLFFHRILLVHGLENAEHARRMLREVWRVLADDGRLLVVAPNRMGMWAHMEDTPFGQGQPYSPGQIGRLLAATFFRVERRDTALFMPPLHLRMVLRTGPVWERLGRAAAPSLAGLTLTEAVKDLYAGLPAQPGARRRMVLADAA